MTDITSYKLHYIEHKLGHNLESSKKHDLLIPCDECNEETWVYIHTSSTHRVLKIISDGIFHHINGDRNNNELDNIKFICRDCHRKTHDWGFGVSNLPEDYKFIPLKK